MGPLLTLGATVPGRLGAVLGVAVLQLIACAVCGYLAVAVRRFVERSGWDRPDDGEEQ